MELTSNIPEQWQIMRLEQLVIPSGLIRGPFGGALKKEVFISSGYKVYTQQNAIYQNTELGQYFIGADKFKELSRFSVKPTDFIVSCSGTIGRLHELPHDCARGIINQALLIIRTDNQKVDRGYFKHFFRSKLFQSQIIDSTQGGAMQNLVGMEEFKKSVFALPSIREQQAIAEALNDADALIASLEKLIEKKQNIFNSTLSALIEIDDNGNTTSASLNSGFQIKARIGWQGLTTKEYLKHGNYLLVTGTEFSDGKVNWEDCWRVEKERFDQDKNIQLKDNDVLITKDGTIGKVAQVNGLKMPATLNSGVFVIRPTTTEVLPRYLFYVFRSKLFKSFLNELSAGSTINHLYQKDIVKFKFIMPKSITRQQHIVSVLDEVKLEISLLSHQLDKAKKVKTGMMHELLTGRMRLV